MEQGRIKLDLDNPTKELNNLNSIVSIDPFESSEFKKNKKLNFLLIYLLAFFSIWLLWGLTVENWLSNEISLIRVLTLLWVKFQIWVLPILLYLYYFEKINPFKYLKLNVKPLKYLLFGILLGVLIVIPGFVARFLVDPLNTQFNLSLLNLNLDSWINGVLMVGIIEEILFRGFVFQRLLVNLGRNASMLLSSFLFVVVHFGYWYALGLTSFQFITATGYAIFLGVYFAYIFLKTGSLWTSIGAHSSYNFVLFLLGV